MTSHYIPLSVPEFKGNEWNYVKDCLDSGWVSSVGAYVDKFEQAVARAAGRKYGVATCNGTSALHISLLLAGVKPGDEVLVSDLTFIAPVNAVRYAGAHPVLVDAEPDFWQMDIDRVCEFLGRCTKNKEGVCNPRTGRRIAALLPVHALGNPVEIVRLCKLSEEFGIPVIEDATESLGAKAGGLPVGGHGFCSCYSFNGNKILTTGGGGVIATDDEGVAERAKYLTTQAKDDPVEYIHHEVGYNYRLTNVQAAIGCAQMERLDEYVEKKRGIASRYAAELGALECIKPMPEPAEARGSFWMYTVLLDPAKGGVGSRELMEKLAAEKIQSRPLWQPMHLSRPYAEAELLGGPVSEQLYRDALSLPCSVGLTDEDQGRVIASLRSFLE